MGHQECHRALEDAQWQPPELSVLNPESFLVERIDRVEKRLENKGRTQQKKGADQFSQQGNRGAAIHRVVAVGIGPLYSYLAPPSTGRHLLSNICDISGSVVLKYSPLPISTMERALACKASLNSSGRMNTSG